jgi:hypothetical protein
MRDEKNLHATHVGFFAFPSSLILHTSALSLDLPRASKSAGAARTLREIVDHVELHLNHRYDHQLGKAVHRVKHKWRTSTIPCRYKNLSLIVGIDQPNQVAEHDAVLMPQPGARQDHGREAGVVQVYGDARGHQFRLSRRQRERVVDTRTQIKSGRAGRCMRGELIAQPRI